MPEIKITPFSEDALNRYRITHSDRDLKPLLSRLHRLPHLPSSIPFTPSPNTDTGVTEPDDYDPAKVAEESRAREKEVLGLEVLKWRVGVERVLGGVRNLEREKVRWERKVGETVARTEQLKSTLEEEKELLKKRLWERDQMIKCDELAKRILARGKSRIELDEQIAQLRTEVEDHRTSHVLYTRTTQSRIQTFDQITRLVEEVRALKLPLEPTSSAIPEEVVSMEVDSAPVPVPVPTSALASTPTLSPQALPFQPSHLPPPPPQRAVSTSTPRATTPPPASAKLPSRPSAPTGSGLGLATSRSSVPARPSNLRRSTGPLAGASMEEGEVGEEGEVEERGGKRGGEGDGRGRSVRSRK